jgi:hypothetical protein
MGEPARHDKEVTPRRGRKRVALAVVLAWLVPGLGHAYLGSRKRAVWYAGLVCFMYLFGLFLEGSLSHPTAGSYLSKLATVADLGVGPLYFLAHAAGWAGGRIASATHEIGNTFHWSAGVLNMLLVLDAHDIAVGRK